VLTPSVGPEKIPGKSRLHYLNRAVAVLNVYHPSAVVVLETFTWKLLWRLPQIKCVDVSQQGHLVVVQSTTNGWSFQVWMPEAVVQSKPSYTWVYTLQPAHLWVKGYVFGNTRPQAIITDRFVVFLSVDWHDPGYMQVVVYDHTGNELADWILPENQCCRIIGVHGAMMLFQSGRTLHICDLFTGRPSGCVGLTIPDNVIQQVFLGLSPTDTAFRLLYHRSADNDPEDFRIYHRPDVQKSLGLWQADLRFVQQEQPCQDHPKSLGAYIVEKHLPVGLAL